MKKILDWYTILPEPFRSQAIHNFKSVIDCDEDLEAGSLADALTYGFNWDKTKTLYQGTRYWKILHEKAVYGEFDVQDKTKKDSNSDKSDNNESELEVKEYFNNLLESKLEPLHKDIKKIKSLMKDILKTFEKITKSK